MSELPVVEYIDAGLADLLDRFFELSRSDLQTMREAVGERDFETLTRLGHTVRGTGHGYGFSGMGEIGHAIEQAAQGRDVDALNTHMDRMDRYLSTVRVEFVAK